MRELLVRSLNNKAVYVNDEATNVGLHLIESPDLLQYVKEVIADADIEGESVALEKDLGRTVGKTSLVETADADEIVYAKRLQREKYTRFLKNKAFISTSFIAIILLHADDGYLLWSAWCGKLVPTSPGDSDEMPKSQGFWRNHALVYDESIIQLDTLTTVCPWK